jgi:ankyrin repeat protein
MTEKSEATEDLFKAFSQGRVDRIIEAIRRGADVTHKDNVNYTPLHYLVYSFSDPYGNAYLRQTLKPEEYKRVIEEYPKLATTLIEKGADINAKDNNGSTPLDVVKNYASDQKFCKKAQYDFKTLLEAMENPRTPTTTTGQGTTEPAVQSDGPPLPQ